MPRSLGPFVVWPCPVRLRFPALWLPAARYVAVPLSLALFVPGAMLLAGFGGWSATRASLGAVLVGVGGWQAAQCAVALWGRTEITIDRATITIARAMFRWRRARTIDARRLHAAIVRRSRSGPWLEVRVEDGERRRSIHVGRGANIPEALLLDLAALLRAVRDAARERGVTRSR